MATRKKSRPQAVRESGAIARPTANAAARPRGARRIAVNAFLIFHLVAILCWSMPLGNPLVVACRNFVRPYMIWSGLFQSWDMFSPTPKTVNSYVEAIVLYKDGTTRNWAFPRMEQLSLTGRYFKERYRKYTENLKEDSNKALWPDAARFIARQNNNGPTPENMILLVRALSDIVPRNDRSYQPSPWNAHVFYGYKVKPEDLE
jgi:hypothetical protein